MWNVWWTLYLESVAPWSVFHDCDGLVDCVQTLVINHKQSASFHVFFGVKHILKL